MNAKNIILAILMVLSFAACSSEIDGIDSNTTSNGAGNLQASSLFVHMVDGNQQTKSGSVEDETAIANYVIAVFEKKSTQRVGYMTGENIAAALVNLEDCKEGNVNVIVVANVANVHAFDNLYTYAEFTSMKVANPDNLTKVGTAAIVLQKDKSNNLEVTLNQLTARVKVTLNSEVDLVNTTDKTVSATFEINNYNYTMVNNSTILNQASQKGSENVANVSVNDFTYYTYPVSEPKLTIDGSFEILVNGTSKSITVEGMNVPFENGSTIEELLAGKSYNLTVNPRLTVKDKNYEVNFSYQLVEIGNIKNEIIYE